MKNKRWRRAGPRNSRRRAVVYRGARATPPFYQRNQTVAGKNGECERSRTLTPRIQVVESATPRWSLLKKRRSKMITKKGKLGYTQSRTWKPGTQRKKQRTRTGRDLLHQNDSRESNRAGKGGRPDASRSFPLRRPNLCHQRSCVSQGTRLPETLTSRVRCSASCRLQRCLQRS